jgi:hypothetical protein
MTKFDIERRARTVYGRQLGVAERTVDALAGRAGGSRRDTFPAITLSDLTRPPMTPALVQSRARAFFEPDQWPVSVKRPAKIVFQSLPVR